MNFLKKVNIYLIASMVLAAGLLVSGCVTNDTRVRLSEPRLQPVAEAEWNEPQTKVLSPLKKFFKDGKVINIFTTLGRHPKLMASWQPFATHVLYTSTLSPRDREILILRIGWLCKSEYEFGQHTLIGKKAGLTDEEILQITKGPDAKGWSKFDAALIRATDELHKDAFVTDSTWKILASKYDEKQMMDLVFTVGEYNLVSMALNSLGVQLDPGIPGFPEGSGL